MNKLQTGKESASRKIKTIDSIFDGARRWKRFTMLVLLLAVALVNSALAQTSPPPMVAPQASPSPPASPSPVSPPPPSLERQFLKNILRDQKAIWTSPFRLRGDDARWLAPLGAGVAGLVLTDRRTSGWVSRGGSLPSFSRKASLGGSGYTAGGIAAGFYLVGRLTNNRRARETGLLAAEALIDSGIVTNVLKLATRRPRPNYDAGRGRFFTGGDSFPSGHASSTWAVATVIAYEYQDRPLVRYGAFAAATLVSLSRYTGRKHFLSDALVGSAIGFGIGRFVYRKRHVATADPQANGNSPPTKSSKLMPVIAPIYDRHAATYGGTLTWNF